VGLFFPGLDPLDLLMLRALLGRKKRGKGKRGRPRFVLFKKKRR